jgi:acyl carrier protein
MTDTPSRLARCFAAVFPNLDAAAIPQASMTSVQGWDSLATINLLTVLEEEFGTQIPTQDLEKLVSFPAILQYLTQDRHD